jgi:hypothetical protein
VLEWAVLAAMRGIDVNRIEKLTHVDSQIISEVSGVNLAEWFAKQRADNINRWYEKPVVDDANKAEDDGEGETELSN